MKAGAPLISALETRLPSADFRRTAIKKPEPPPQGLDAVLHGWIGHHKRRESHLRELRRLASEVETKSKSLTDLRDHDLKATLAGHREQFRRAPESRGHLLIGALAAVLEAADRSLGLRAFHVQLIGALAMHRGWLAEMATGEGKTLTAGLAAVLAGWSKRPVHLVTVNDYLAERDAERLGPLYAFCGVTVGFVTGSMDSGQRAREYSRDVTYTTSKELLADFLRDRLRLGSLQHATKRVIRRLLQPRAEAVSGLVLRGLHTAIVDEADSILIDEAVTPLIISEPRKNEMLREVGRMAAKFANELIPTHDYLVHTRHKEVELTEAGLRKLSENSSAMPGFWRSPRRRAEVVRTALDAREFFHRDLQYIVEHGKVVIVDEFTGRPMPQRTWREGLHQAIEAKEKVELSDPTETVARMSFQRFFRSFYKLSGMTGTAWETTSEFWQVYRLRVVRIPLNRPCIRQDLPDRRFRDHRQKWDAIVDEVERMHRSGRPILIGTRSVERSEFLARRLDQRGVSFRLLNATRLSEEAAIIAGAGERNRITIATNMAGRGTDIKLGEGVRELGGLHVIATDRHESRRIDRQLFGRAGRQGDPGSAQAFVSGEDDLLRRHLALPLQRILQATRYAPSLTGLAFQLAQRRAQHVAWRQRVSVQRADAWLDEALAFAGD